MKPTLRIIYLFVLASCIWGSVRAQETSAGLRGLIRDTAGMALQGATVTAVHVSSGTRYSTVTGRDGRYNLPGLRVGGPYSVEAGFSGMNTEMGEVRQIGLGESLILNFVLSGRASVLTNVVVTGRRSAPKANTYGSGMNISRDQIRNQPTLNRSITDITKLVPQGSRDNSFAGTNFRYNNVTIDGAINNDAIGFSPSAGGQTGSSGMPGSSTRTNPISLDAIEDIQVYIAPYDVKIGNFTGGSINAVTRSGTNEVHGSIYGYGRNAVLIGPDHTGSELGSSMPSSYYDYQTGGRIGLPIIKNRLFFFTNIEVTGRREPILQVAGSPASAGVLSKEDAAAIIDYTKQHYQFDPGTAGQYDASAHSYKFFGRVDWNINDRNQLAVRSNLIRSKSVNMERDQLDFRFGSIAYQQNNNQLSTVAELKTRFSNNFSNNAVVGYTNIHDYRTPLGDPSFPQVQIVGRTPGSTIFFGTDREASIFDMNQRTIELTDNLVWNLGKHTLTVGTHNELYKIKYGFVNAWNGRVTYQSIEDFLNNDPERVQGSYNYVNNDRSYILSHPGAQFNINFYSVYVQDEVQVSERFRITPGLRADYQDVSDKQALSQKTRGAFTDPYFGNTYTYTPLNQITGSYLGKVMISPRIGFRFDAFADQSLVLRGGVGMFTSRIPFAWLGYAFYNTGNSYGSYDQKSDGNPPYVFNGDPLSHQPGRGIGDFASKNGQVINDVNAGKTQVDVVAPDFTMPKVLRGSLALDYKDANGFKYTIEGIYSKTIKDVKFQQVNLTDNPSYYYYDSSAGTRHQPLFAGQNPRNPQFANAYELSNTAQGYRYSITGQVARNFAGGFGFSAAYTYGRSKDISNGIRNSFESNWQLNQALNPNDPKLANSNFDIRHRIVVTASYRKAWNDSWITNVSLFVTAQSGSPFTYGFVNYTPQNTPQQVALAYVPAKGETVNFFGATATKTAQQQAAEFDRFIDGNDYLRSRRGGFTERNAAFTPWNNNADLHVAQDINFVSGRKGSDVSKRTVRTLTVSLDIINLTSLLNPDWGKVYFSPNTYNSTASVGLVPYVPGRSSQGYPVYMFQDPGKPYSVDVMNSRWQMQVGARYSF